MGHRIYFLNKEDAEAARILFDKEHIIDKSKLPMSEDEWSSLGYGYGEDGRTLENKGGYSIEDFKEMERMMSLNWTEWNPSAVGEFELK